MLFMGLRRGELAGLEWKDIDYENKTMTIARFVQDIIGFGLITKEPKTENSKRTISMPDKLINYLKKYEAWWLILEIGSEIQIDYSAHKMAQIYSLGYLEYG